MAAFSTRINLLPTSRTLASGVPFAPRIALVHPPASHGHGTHGPRSDAPPKWTGSQGGFASHSRINSEYTILWLEYGQKRRMEGKFASSIGLLGLLRKIKTRRMKTDCLAPPTGIFQQRTFSTTPSRPIEAPSRVGGVPDWSAYQSSGKGENTRTLSYFMVGSLGVLAASGAKSTVSDILSNMAASADVLALAKIEVEMGSIPEGMS